MEGLKLCHYKKASSPFRISEPPYSLYTIEELCYYLYHNLYIIEKSSILTANLLSWIEKELNLPDLSKELMLKDNFEARVETILRYADFCNQEEWNQLLDMLEELKSQNKEDRIRLRADHFLKNHKFHAAIVEYKKIMALPEVKEKEQILNNIGIAFSNLFLYENAAEYLLLAYQCNKNSTILRNLLYCYYFGYSRQDFLEKTKEFELPDSTIRELEAVIKERSIQMDSSQWGRQIESATKVKRGGDLASYYQELEKIICDWKQEYLEETT